MRLTGGLSLGGVVEFGFKLGFLGEKWIVLEGSSGECEHGCGGGGLKGSSRQSTAIVDEPCCDKPGAVSLPLLT